jgi:hypothetical protein
MPQTILIALREEWHEAWHTRGFRRKVIIGMLLVITILSSFPVFFQTIEKRHGFLLHDAVLEALTPHNVSLAIFIIIWAASLLSIFRAVQHPYMFLTFVWAYIFLSIFRVLTITLVPLEPPIGLIGLVDPLSNFFYGDKFVTRDLFFSGHTSSVFLLYLCIPGKTDKKLILLATFCVGALLLVQHVHYTLDVLAAPVFAWIAWLITRKTLVRQSY